MAAGRASSGAVRARKRVGGGARELGRLRALCLALPGAVEHLSHGEPTWRRGPGGLTFAMFDNHHHGGAHVSVYLAAPPEVQRALVAAEPDRYWVPPYVGHRGWVAVILDTGPDWERVGELVRAAFDFQGAPRRAPRRRARAR